MSLLVTNDFPPKLGGIQTYLYELWRRLPDTVVITGSPADSRAARAWDAAQPFRIERIPQKVLLPTRRLTDRVRAIASEIAAPTIFIDPMLPLGRIGAHLNSVPHVIVAHGAEVTFYGRVPGTAQLTRRVLRDAAGVVAAGNYPAQTINQITNFGVPTIEIPPGVDTARFQPLSYEKRRATRLHFGLDPEAPLVLGLSRLVPRKGFDVVIDAVEKLSGVHLAIAGVGRDRARLERRARRLGSRSHFLGKISDDQLPALYGAADIFAMPCRDRWGGLEAEGFGIVFLEAAACGVPAVAGRSGGAHEAVSDGESGFVVDPRSVSEVSHALGRLVDDSALRLQMGTAARQRAELLFSYDKLAMQLAPLANGDLSNLVIARKD